MFSLLLAAALLFSIGGYFMKLSHGLRVLWPSVLVFACFCAGAALQALAMRNEPMSVTYTVVLGLEVITAYLLATMLLNEPTTIVKIAGVGLVVAGIVVLQFARG